MPAQSPTQDSVNGTRLYMAMELSSKEWLLGFSNGSCRRMRRRKVAARDLLHLDEEIRRAKEHFGLQPNCPVVSCYEAGRDGFWLHRYLIEQGVKNLVVDSASIERPGHKRNPKSDKLDVEKLLSMLLRDQQSQEKNVWRPVHVPDEQAEDQRHPHRELEELKHDATALSNRMKGLLVTQGVELHLAQGFLQGLKEAKTPDGRPLGKYLKARLRREWSRLQQIRLQIRQLNKERMRMVRTDDAPAVEKVRTMTQLKGIGLTTSWVLVMEFFGWRTFDNRRQLGSAAGLVGAPWDSGDTRREQGITKAGNALVRTKMVEVSWCWLRWQPDSALTRWFSERFGNSKRSRKSGIVAVARKLLIALWRFVEHGVVPEGAIVAGGLSKC